MTMAEQSIPVLFDERAIKSTQYSTALQGIRQAASRCGQHVQLLPADSLREEDYASLPEVAVLISVSMPLIVKTIEDMRRHGRFIVLSGIDCEQFGTDVSCATPSRRTETQQMVNYLYNCGKKRIALVGFGLNSINDTFRYRAAMTAAAAWGTILSEKDVWLWQHDPAECFHAFLQVADRYDAIICPNDVISICLINECKKQGIDIPGMLYLASFGNMSLGSYFRPTITSISMDMLRVGEQTFNVWRYLLTSGTPSITSLKITVPSRILVRESTGNQPFRTDLQPNSGLLNADRFYYNSVISVLVGLDYCISQRDELDMRVIKSILNHESYEQICDRYYISSSTLRYRLHKIYGDAGVASRKEFEELIRSHLGEGNPFSFME